MVVWEFLGCVGNKVLALGVGVWGAGGVGVEVELIDRTMNELKITKLTRKRWNERR